MSKRLTRKEVCYRLKCSVASLQRFEQSGQLKPLVETTARRGGVITYDAGEVLELSKTWKPKRTKFSPRLKDANALGSVSAKVFRLLEEAKANGRLDDQEKLFCRIVIEAEVDPLLARQLYREWTLGLEKAEVLEKQRQQEAEEKEAQRVYEMQRERETWREWKLRLAKIEAGKTG